MTSGVYRADWRQDPALAPAHASTQSGDRWEGCGRGASRNFSSGVVFTKAMEFHMKRPCRWLLVAAVITTFCQGASAASRTAWDGTWRGSWGGSAPTSITIAHNRVLSYEYQGVSTPVVRSRVTRKRVTYGDNGTTVILTKTSSTTAFAKLHSPQGDATAELLKE